MIANRIVLPPCFVIQVESPEVGGNQIEEKLNAAVHALEALSDARVRGCAKSVEFGSTLETYLRRMVTQIAISVKLVNVKSFLGSARDTRALLSPSIRTRLSLVDQRKAIWHAIKTYFQPVLHDLNRVSTHESFSGDIDLAAWHLYLLCIACKHSAEAPLSVGTALDNLRRLETTSSAKLSPESLTRLRLVASVFEAFSSPLEIPALQLHPELAANAIRDRIHEILEDAYLLEASRLRRFAGLRQNVASVRRDLRLALRTVRKHSHWAKGILKVGTSYA